MKLKPIMLIAALVFAVAAAAACEKSITSGGTTRYDNSQYHFSFEIADRFKQADSASTAQSNRGAAFNVAFTNPAGTTAGGQMIDGFLVSVYTLTQAITPDLMPAMKRELDGALKQLAVADPSVKMNPLTETTVNGLSGWQADYTMDMNGAPVQSRTCFLVKGATEYQLTIQSSVDHWTANEADLQKAIDSFKVQ